MSYITRTLGPHERILFVTGYHWLVWLGAALCIAPTIAILAGGYPYEPADYAFLALCFGALPFGLFYLGRAISTEIAVTNERFVKKSGIVSFDTEEIGLDNIETISVEQPILGRLLGYGTLTVHGTGREQIKISMINRPVSLRRHIPMAQEAAFEDISQVAA